MQDAQSSARHFPSQGHWANARSSLDGLEEVVCQTYALAELSKSLIFPKKCAKSQNENDKGVAAYIQVKDLSDKKDDKVFVFNGWTFSSSPTLRTFDHPVYDIWVTGCENI